jgi:hypothetical protein
MRPEFDGTKIAELVFPLKAGPLDDVVLQLLPGIKLDKDSHKTGQSETIQDELTRRQKIHQWLRSQKAFLARNHREMQNIPDDHLSEVNPVVTSNDPSRIMSYIPAMQHGSVPMVRERLQTYLDNHKSSSG